MIIKKLLLTKRTIRELKKCGLTYKELSKSFDCTVWNRDINSSRNMIDISLHKDRPIILCRPKNDVASFTPASLVQIQDLAV